MQLHEPGQSSTVQSNLFYTAKIKLLIPTCRHKTANIFPFCVWLK
jgi:hypothetical protein